MRRHRPLRSVRLFGLTTLTFLGACAHGSRFTPAPETAARPDSVRAGTSRVPLPVHPVMGAVAGVKMAPMTHEDSLRHLADASYSFGGAPAPLPGTVLRPGEYQFHGAAGTVPTMGADSLRHIPDASYVFRPRASIVSAPRNPVTAMSVPGPFTPWEGGVRSVGVPESWETLFRRTTVPALEGAMPASLTEEYRTRLCRVGDGVTHLTLRTTGLSRHATVGRLLRPVAPSGNWLDWDDRDAARTRPLDFRSPGLELPVLAGALDFVVAGLTCGPRETELGGELGQGWTETGIVLEREGRFLLLTGEVERERARLDRSSGTTQTLGVNWGDLPAGVSLTDGHGHPVRLRVLEDGRIGFPTATVQALDPRSRTPLEAP